MAGNSPAFLARFAGGGLSSPSPRSCTWLEWPRSTPNSVGIPAGGGQSVLAPSAGATASGWVILAVQPHAPSAVGRMLLTTDPSLPGITSFAGDGETGRDVGSVRDGSRLPDSPVSHRGQGPSRGWLRFRLLPRATTPSPDRRRRSQTAARRIGAGSVALLLAGRPVAGCRAARPRAAEENLPATCPWHGASPGPGPAPCAEP